MNKEFRSLLHIAIILLFAGCQTDLTTEIIDGKYLTVSIEKTRTSLGEKVGKTYPVYWNANDQIVVNGEISGKAQINSDNKGVASFLLSDNAKYPYSITYPYCTSTTATTPVVEFPAEQSYTEGSFGANCAPMCGYAEEGQNVALKHLATILRLPVKSIAEGVTLEKVVVTSSTAKLAGEFSVDCQNATIEATATTINNITYTVNQTLSTSTETVLYISLPAVNAGSCTLEFFDSKGGKMSGNWSAGELNAGIIKAFKCIEYSSGGSFTLTPFENEFDSLIFDRNIFGYVKDSAGNPIEGVAVSDGFTVVSTDSDGYYTINSVSPKAWYIYISLPAEYEVPLNEFGQPYFYQEYKEGVRDYNFELTPLTGGKEEQFALFAIGDPQVTNTDRYNLFKTYAIPGIKSHCQEVRSKGTACYAITLGDLISSSTGANDEHWRKPMRNSFAYTNTGLPVFHVMGNHDYTYCDTETPLTLDEKSPDVNLAMQRDYESVFGPVNYSFNRGDFHIIGMKNIYYNSVSNGGSIDRGFTAEQYEWLKQDLAFVPKNKGVILCVHIPLFNYTGRYIEQIIELLNQYNDAHILSGHTHINRNYEHKEEGLATTKIYEHNAGALCGAWWCSHMCGDGTPNGYQVFICGNDGDGGGKIKNWYFTGYHEGMNTPAHQMRLYRGNAVTGAAIPEGDANTYGVKGYYGFNYGDNVLLANVYNADSKWKIEVYEDGKYSGDMSLIEPKRPALSSLIGSYTESDPRRASDGVKSSQDMYVAGLFLGILERYTANGPGSGAWTTCHHMYRFELQNKTAEIKVVATDRFGNKYTETKITEGKDYSLIMN